MKAEKELENYGIKIFQSKNDDRYLIDFILEDKDTGDEYATVWGYGLNDVEFECNHPYECVEFGDDDEQGQCMLCGSYCDWRRVPDEDTPGYPEPTEWYPRRNAGGLIKEYLDELLRAKNG